MKRFRFFITLLVIACNLSAQNSAQGLIDQLNYVFQNLDKSRISTGFLSDYGIQVIDPVYFNGIPADSNYVDMETWKILYSVMFSSKINNNVNPIIPETVFTQIDNTTHSTAVPLAMMHFQYNQLNENAVNQGLLQIVNGQIIDVPGAASPYLTKQLFAVAPKELSFDGPTASFVFKSNLWYSNANKTIQKREINFNNESGYLLANWDTPVSYTFASGGIKTIYFKLTYTDGTSYTSQTNVSVTESSIALRAYIIGVEPDIDWPATSQHFGGKIQIAYSSYNYSGTIRKPLIVAEGFDPLSVLNPEDGIDIQDFIYQDSLSAGTINVSYSGGNLRDNIELAQYDIIYLDYNNGVDDIWRNARLFREIINWVNQNKVGNEPNVVMGISMGGLVARIALRQMEVAGENHQTSKFISVDSPHKGANVPLGYQALVRHLQEFSIILEIGQIFGYDYYRQLRQVIELLDSPAAQQMLIYSINSQGSFANTVHNQFQTEYDNLGFPQQCQNVAIANGSNYGTALFAPGANLVNYNYEYGLKWWMDLLSGLFSVHLSLIRPNMILNAVPGNSNLKIQVEINALKNQTAGKIYQGRIYYEKKLLWVLPVNTDIINKQTYSLSSMFPIDGAPGGIYDIAMIANRLPFDNNAITRKQFCFVPTVSSLAIPNWTSKLTQNLNGSGLNIPFNHYFSQSNNEAHTDFHSSAGFLYNQLVDYKLSGPDTIYCGDSGYYAIENLPSSVSGSQIIWTCSSNLQLVGGSNGTSKTVDVLSKNSSTGWIKAHISENGGSVVVQKDIRIPYFMSVSITDNSGINAGYFHANTNPQATTYEWRLNSQHVGGNSPNVPYARTNTSSSILNTLKVTASNSCYSREYEITVYGNIQMPEAEVEENSYISCYPNPASTTLTVAIDETKYSKSWNYLQAMSQSNSSQKLSPSFVISLCTFQGVLLQQQNIDSAGSSTQFDVSGLYPGLYFLQVYDNLSSKTILRKITIQ
jgi:hypothetical protein